MPFLTVIFATIIIQQIDWLINHVVLWTSSSPTCLSLNKRWGKQYMYMWLEKLWCFMGRHSNVYVLEHDNTAASAGTILYSKFAIRRSVSLLMNLNTSSLFKREYPKKTIQISPNAVAIRGLICSAWQEMSPLFPTILSCHLNKLQTAGCLIIYLPYKKFHGKRFV